MLEEISHLPMTSPPLSFARARPGETDMGPDKPYARRFAASNKHPETCVAVLRQTTRSAGKPGNYQFSKLAGLDDLSRLSRFTEASTS